MPRTRRSQSKPEGRYHHGDLRRALLDTALRIVEQDGIDALTIRELARRLGVSHAAPAHHFPDKASLLAEIAAEGFARFADALEAAGAGPGDPEERFARLGDAYLRFATDHPAHLRVMFGRELATLGPPPPPLARTAERAYAALLAGVANLLPGAPAAELDAAAFAAWSLVHGAALLRIDGPYRLATPARFAELARYATRLGASALAGRGRAGTGPPASAPAVPDRAARPGGTPSRSRRSP